MDRATKENVGKVNFTGGTNGSERFLIVYTNPIPKARPRFTRAGHAYTPKKTSDYEELIRECWMMTHKEMFIRPVKMTVDFYMQIPKSWSKAKKKRASEGELLPAAKPDIDNLLKSVLDALNGIAFYDDCLLVKIIASEYYSISPRVEIWIGEVEDGNL